MSLIPIYLASNTQLYAGKLITASGGLTIGSAYANTTAPVDSLIVSGNIGIGTTIAANKLTVYGDILTTGIFSNPLLQTGPYVAFDGSAANSNAFLSWMQYATSTQYRYNLTLNTSSATSSFWGSNIIPNVKVYDTLTYSTIAAGAPGSAAYIGGVLMPDGRVVFVPYNATTVGIFNPATNTYSTVAGAPGSLAYRGGVLMPDGRVVFVPGNATTVGIFNPATNTYSTIAAGAPGSAAYLGGVLMPDGRVVFVPGNATTVGIFNPDTNTYSTVAGAPGSGAYTGGVLMPDGRVVFVPGNATTVGLLNTAQLVRAPPIELCYHPCFNKY